MREVVSLPLLTVVPQSSEFDFNNEQLQAALMGRVVNYDNTETRNMSNHITALYATWYHLSQKSPFSVLFKTLSKVKAAMKDILATYSRDLPAFMEHVSLLTDHLRSLVQSCKNLMGANNSFTFNLMAAKADSDIESLVSSNTEQQSLEHSDQVKQITCLLPNIAHLAGLTDEELDRRAYTLLPTTTCLEGHFLARRSAPLLDSLELSQSIQTVAALTSQGLSPGSSRPTSGVTSPDPEEKLDHLSPLKLVPLFSDYRHPPALKIEK